MKKLLSILSITTLIASGSGPLISCNINDSNGGGILPNPAPHPDPTPDPSAKTIADFLEQYKEHAKNIVLDQDTRNNWDSGDSGKADSEMLYAGIEADIYNEYSLMLDSLFNIVKINDLDVSTDQELRTTFNEIKQINNSYFIQGIVPDVDQQNVSNLGGLINFQEVEASFDNYLTNLHNSDYTYLNNLVKLLVGNDTDLSLVGSGELLYYNKEKIAMNNANKWVADTYDKAEFDAITKRQNVICIELQPWLNNHA